LPHICIFEDDVTFPLDFHDKLNKCISELPEDWDLFYLAGTNKAHPSPYSENVNRCYGAWGTFAYIIRESVYDVILNELVRHRLTVDGHLIKISGLINCYIAKKKIVSHSVGFSYITNTHRNITWLQ
jgi:GR25 family glycosyltransferase involved in LPS biosynthesis